MQNTKTETPAITNFTSYQKFVVLILAATQFSVILDFMIMSPLGAILMKALSLKPQAFGFAVSAYAFSAGLSGLLTAGFADRFDRKKILVFFYLGFIAGTILCGLSHTYVLLVMARIVTGLFGGVISSISMAIIADIFSLQQRGRVMGYVQMGFGASQVLGIPIGLYLANALGWETPFWMVAGLSLTVVLLIAIFMQPVIQHLSSRKEKSALKHLWHSLSNGNYVLGFIATALLSIGGFMLMPFSSTFAIHNLGLSNQELPLFFMASGICTLIIMPLIGRLSDKIDKFRIFMVASIWMAVIVAVYNNLGITPFPIVMFLNILMIIGVMSRMIPLSALISAIPELPDRGAFMSINSSLQQVAGGIAAAVAAMIVTQDGKDAPLKHYGMVGYIVITITLLSILVMTRVSKLVKKRN